MPMSLDTVSTGKEPSVLDLGSNWMERETKEALLIQKQVEICPLIYKDHGWHVGNVWCNVLSASCTW